MTKVRLRPTVLLTRIASGFLSLLLPSIVYAASVTLSWDPLVKPPEGYRVFVRQANQSYDYGRPSWNGNTTTCTIDNLDNGTTYYFVVRAYDGELESVNSNEVNTTTASGPDAGSPTDAAAADDEPTVDTRAPAWDGATTGVGLAADSGTGDGISVEFDTAMDDVDGENIKYNVYYSASDVWNSADWSRNNSILDAALHGGGTFTHCVSIDGLRADVNYTVGVRVEDQSGNEDANVNIMTATPTNGAAANTSVAAGVGAVEFGDVEIDHLWETVRFASAMNDPVVVAGPIALEGGQPAVVRIRNTASTGFDIRVQEWDYLDGRHAVETVSYLAMEQGVYTLANGTVVEADSLAINAANDFRTVSFNGDFSVPPIVMVTITSENDANAVTGRVKQITANGFSFRLQEQESNAQNHGTETLSYIAWEPSSGKLGEIDYLVDRTGNSVRNTRFNIDFGMSFTRVPALMACMQTTDGGDPANVRCGYKNNASAGILIDEEESRDTEVGHTSEDVGFILLGR